MRHHNNHVDEEGEDLYNIIFLVAMVIIWIIYSYRSIKRQEQLEQATYDKFSWLQSGLDKHSDII
jgi:hypothetical protein